MPHCWVKRRKMDHIRDITNLSRNILLGLGYYAINAWIVFIYAILELVVLIVELCIYMRMLKVKES